MSFSDGPEWDEIVDKMMEKQGRKCGGCQIPLTSVGMIYVNSDQTRYQTEGEGVGFVNMRIPKRLKGKDEPSNYWLLCADCSGSTTVNSQMPTWLYNKAKAYRDENLEDFRSMTHLVREALEHYISTEGEQKEKARMAEAGRELELSVAKWIESMPDQLSRRFSLHGKSPSADIYVGQAGGVVYGIDKHGVRWPRRRLGWGAESGDDDSAAAM